MRENTLIIIIYIIIHFLGSYFCMTDRSTLCIMNIIFSLQQSTLNALKTITRWIPTHGPTRTVSLPRVERCRTCEAPRLICNFWHPHEGFSFISLRHHNTLPSELKIAFPSLSGAPFESSSRRRRTTTADCCRRYLIHGDGSAVAQGESDWCKKKRGGGMWRLFPSWLLWLLTKSSRNNSEVCVICSYSAKCVGTVTPTWVLSSMHFTCRWQKTEGNMPGRNEQEVKKRCRRRINGDEIQHLGVPDLRLRLTAKDLSQYFWSLKKVGGIYKSLT